MAYPQPPPGQRPVYPNPNPNSLTGPMQNMQISNRPPPSSAPSPFASRPGPGPTPPFGAAPMARPGPSSPSTARPQAIGRPSGPPPPFAGTRPVASNGPVTTQVQDPMAGGARPFGGNPPGVAPVASHVPFSGARPASQSPFVGAPPAAQVPTSGALLQSQPPVSGSQPQSQPPFSGAPLGARPPPFAGAPPASSRPPFTGTTPTYQPQSSQQQFAAPPQISQQPLAAPTSVSRPAAIPQPPFVGTAMTPQPPFSRPTTTPQLPFAGTATTAQPPFAGAPPSSRPPFSGAPPTSQTPFTGATAPLTQPPFTGGVSFAGVPPSPRPPFSGLPPSSQPFTGMPPPPPQAFSGSQMFQGAPTSGGLHGSPTWSSQVPPGASLIPNAMLPPPKMYGMPSQAPSMPIMSHSPVSTPSKIDPNQIPRPAPGSSVVIFETRQGGQANVPPPASSDFVVRDTGNCSPRYMRCTINQIPCTGDLLSTSGMPLSLLVQPFALPHPSEEPIQVVDFGESGPLRCSRCKGYVNPFMKFIDQGRRFICNLCGFTDDTPRDYNCNLGPDGRRRDADERPELCRGTVEFVATKEYMVRDPMPAVFFFLVDVSMNAVQTGATAAACSAISLSMNAIVEMPEGPRPMVGIATFDSTIHFYNLKRSQQQPLMLIVPDVQDVYTPLHTDLIVQFIECRQHLELLLESIPTMFANTKVAESALGAAMKASFLAMKPTGGKLLVFQSVLPSVGIGSLSAREAEGRTNVTSGEKESHKLLQPADKTLKTMAIDFAEYQVCVDIFITTQTYVDIASISVVPRTTGGQVYYYYPFSAISDSAKLYNDLKWNITRPQGFEAVMRVRCSQGLQVQEYFGNFCKRIPTDIDLPGIDCDKTIMVTFKHDDKFQEGTECAFQCALLYTTMYGQRRIRVTNLSLPCTSMLSNLFRSADLDSQFGTFLKQGANDIPTSPLSQVREQVTNHCISILHSYRKYCATVSSSGQLILPEALKLLPLYTLALVKSVGLRTDGRLDDRSYWVHRAVHLSTAWCVPLVYPRMIAIHDLPSTEDGSLIPSTAPLSSEHVTDNGIYLLENGEDALVYVGNSVNPDILQKIFGVTSIDAVPPQLVLEQYGNELSKKLNDVVNEIRRQRCSYLRLRLCKKGDPSGMLFFSYMIEDKSPGGLSYVEFLVHVHRQIQTKMA